MAYALTSQGAAVRICGRNARAACAVVNQVRTLFPEAHAEYISWDDLGNLRNEVDIIVNTTPVGMAQS